MHVRSKIKRNFISAPWQTTYYYVPRQSSRRLYEDPEFKVWAKGEDGKNVSEYKQFDYLSTYDTLSGIGKRKREFFCRGVEVKLRPIVLRTCGVIS